MTTHQTEDPTRIELNTIFKNCDLNGFELFPESNEYWACSFNINGKRIIFRKAKITPKKIGQFVAIWKRTEEGITAPYADNDAFDFMAIDVPTSGNQGLFIFPMDVLIKRKIISENGKGGKRGMRVYPPWDKALNKQAIKTQGWQTSFFHTEIVPTIFH